MSDAFLKFTILVCTYCKSSFWTYLDIHFYHISPLCIGKKENRSEINWKVFLKLLCRRDWRRGSFRTPFQLRVDCVWRVWSMQDLLTRRLSKRSATASGIFLQTADTHLASFHAAPPQPFKSLTEGVNRRFSDQVCIYADSDNHVMTVAKPTATVSQHRLQDTPNFKEM